MPKPAAKAQVFNYAGVGREYAAIVTDDSDGVTITVPTRRSRGRMSLAIASADLFAFVLVPFGWLAFVLLATRRPRAVIRLTRAELAIAETDDNGLGLVTRRRRWPLASIGEMRPNRFGPGLYVTIRGRDSFDLFTDLPTALIRVVADALAAARDRV